VNVLPLPNNARGISATGGPEAADGLPRPRRGVGALAGPVRRDRDGALVSLDRAAAAPVAASKQVAEQLRAICDGARVVLLHHRAASDAVPRLDHLAVGPSGVWVTHSRVPSGRVETRQPMFGRTKLTIGGRERMDLLATLEAQRTEIARALALDHPTVDVRSALCFADTEPPLQRLLYLGSYLFFGTESLAVHLGSDGPLEPATVQAVAETLEAAFPPA
jgi:hypothetical protein